MKHKAPMTIEQHRHHAAALKAATTALHALSAALGKHRHQRRIAHAIDTIDSVRAEMEDLMFEDHNVTRPQDTEWAHIYFDGSSDDTGVKPQA